MSCLKDFMRLGFPPWPEFNLNVHDAQLHTIYSEAHFRDWKAIAQPFLLFGCGSAPYPQREMMEIFISNFLYTWDFTIAINIQ